MNDEVLVKRKRGRPRSAAAIERDELTLTFLLAQEFPVTKHAVAEFLGCSQNMAYLSLCRLRSEGRARRHNNAWTFENVQ